MISSTIYLDALDWNMLTFTKEGAHQLTTVTTVSTYCIVVLHPRALFSIPLQY
jgi:hypothetical protein